jgi:hypothetical protein
MLFTDNLLFIHPPKTGGMSVTKFLIDNAPGEITLAVPPGHAPIVSRDLTIIDGMRHETLPEAPAALAASGRTLDRFKVIISTVRNPYDLEVSYFHHLKKAKAISWMTGLATDLALAGDFLEFARRAPYRDPLPREVEDWYQVDGKMPENMRIVRFENLEVELLDIVTPLFPIVHKLERRNVTLHPPYSEYLSPDTEAAIYRKYRWIFDSGLYPRETDLERNTPISHF